MRKILHRGDPFGRGIAHEEMKPIPLMIAAIFLTLVAALVACHLAWISDLVMVTIILALLIVFVATEPESGECDQPRTKSPSVLPTSSPGKFPAAARMFAASWRRPLGLSRRDFLPAPAEPSCRSLATAESRPACLADAIRPRRRTLAHAMAGIRFIN